MRGLRCLLPIITLCLSLTALAGDDAALKAREYHPPASFALADGPPSVFLARGLYHEYWRLPEIVPFLGGTLSSGAVVVNETGASIRDFPTEHTVLARHRICVLANVPAAALTLEQRAMLEEFVKVGGGLIVLGGPYSFHAGGYHDSEILARLLPVTLTTSADLLACTPPQPLKSAGPNTLAADLLAGSAPVVLHRHALAAKKGATVQVTAGAAPLIVTTTYGRGRVVAVLATPLGDAPATMTPWWAWDKWPVLMLRLLNWAAGG